MPGHGEGDLVFGRRPSAVGTLVERHRRDVLLFPAPGPVHGRAHAARVDCRRAGAAPAAAPLAELGPRPRDGRALQFTIDSGVQVYFCDPRSPWQRGSNENTNGLLRQYLPRSADLRQLDQDALDTIAAELNGRPRQTLGFKTPSQLLAEALR